MNASAALGAGGRGFESRHPDQLFSNVLSITGLLGDSRCLSRHVVRRGSLSVHVGSHLRIGLISSCLSDLVWPRLLQHAIRAARDQQIGRLATCRRSHLEPQRWAAWCRVRPLLHELRTLRSSYPYVLACISINVAAVVNSASSFV